eukprot:scaffold184_cov379-Prasinococcus_capsulatus_cf.AAC.13
MTPRSLAIDRPVPATRSRSQHARLRPQCFRSASQATAPGCCCAAVAPRGSKTTLLCVGTAGVVGTSTCLPRRPRPRSGAPRAHSASVTSIRSCTPSLRAPSRPPRRLAPPPTQPRAESAQLRRKPVAGRLAWLPHPGALIRPPFRRKRERERAEPRRSAKHHSLPASTPARTRPRTTTTNGSPPSSRPSAQNESAPAPPREGAIWPAA